MPSNTLKLKDDGRNILQEGDSITVTEKDNKYSIKIDTKDMHIQVFKKPWFSSSPTKEFLEVVIDSDNKIKYNGSAFSGERNIEGYKNLSLNTLDDARKVLTEVIENLKTENDKMSKEYLIGTVIMDVGLASPYPPLQLQYVPQYGKELDTLEHILKLLRE